jgi:hypothetical protein
MKRKEGREERNKIVNSGVNIIKVHNMHVWKCHDETPYYVQFNIYQLKKRKKENSRPGLLL